MKGKRITGASDIVKSTVQNLNGLAYKGPRKSGFASAMDGEAGNAYINDLSRFGGPDEFGAMAFRLVKHDGSPLDGARTINIGGKMYSSANGVFRIVDSDALKKQKQIAMEKDKYVNDVFELCITSDIACWQILGGDNFDLLKPNGDVPGVKNDKIKEADGQPSTLNALPDSDALRFGMAKLKALISHVGPIVDGLGTPSQEAIDKIILP